MAGTIVCAVDESHGAQEAVRVAVRLSDRLELRLVLAHIARAFDVRDGEPGRMTAGELDVSGGHRLLERVAADHQLGVAADRRVEVGDPAERLSEVAADEQAELIVIGSRPHGRLRPALASRLANELRQATACPVLVAPPPRGPNRALRADS